MTAKNKYTGEVEIQLGDKTVVVCFDWKALSAAETQLGKDYASDLYSTEVDKLCTILLIGLQKRNPEITREMIFDASPAPMKVAKALDQALLFAKHGDEEATKILEEIDQLSKNGQKILDSVKKKTKKAK